MTDPEIPTPAPVTNPLIGAIERLAIAQETNSSEISELSVAVHEESEARDRKVDALQITVGTLRRTNLLLLTLATVLLFLIGLSIFVTVQSQDDTLVNRETTTVIAICQRQNPTDPSIDPDINTSRLVDCVQKYFPGFELPQPRG